MTAPSGHTPAWFTTLRIFQLTIALAVVALNAYHLHYIRYYIYLYTIAVSSTTALTTLYLLLASPQPTITWPLLALDTLTLLLWLPATALTATLAHAWSTTCSSSGPCYHKRADTTPATTYRAAVIAVAALCALESVLFLATLLASTFLRRRRYRKPCPAPPPPPRPIQLDAKHTPPLLPPLPPTAHHQRNYSYQQQSPFQLAAGSEQSLLSASSGGGGAGGRRAKQPRYYQRVLGEAGEGEGV